MKVAVLFLTFAFGAEPNAPITVVTSRDDHMLDEPHVLAEKSVFVPKGSNMKILGAGSELYVRASFGRQEGYMLVLSIDRSDHEVKAKIDALVLEAKENEKERKTKEKMRMAEEAWARRVAKDKKEAEEALAREQARKQKEQARRGSVSIGMTTERVLSILGEPDDIHRTETATAIYEQWVYGTGSYRFLYFQNGVLTATQN